VGAGQPKLLERAGATQSGSITGLYTVLVEGDDLDDPIADSSRALLDGHIVLSRRLASRGHYPPVDVGESISRAMRDVTSADHMQQAVEVKAIVAAYQEAEDLVSIGAYARGSNTQIDRALEFIDPINDYLRQGLDEGSNMSRHVQQLLGLLEPRVGQAEVA
jgi:flagellum-specific ATP synthase